jgi:hypothetical protein
VVWEYFEVVETTISSTLAPLILDFLEWLSVEPRPYAEVMEAWRTSCPRFTVWEDAVDNGFIVRRCATETGMLVELTSAGREFLAANGRRAL